MATTTNKRITYSELLQRISAAEDHYQRARANHVNGGPQNDTKSRQEQTRWKRDDISRVMSSQHTRSGTILP